MKAARPIRRLLIANRGEIAARIARTAHRLGIGTIGVYSEPDRNAFHVDSVERAVALGGAAPAESYLRSERLIEAAVRTGCDAVHPGYGFLAESAAFARAVEAAGLIWVGPGAEQIDLLGDKLAAKEVAEAAGVPTAPAYRVAPGNDLPEVEYPVIVKAAAGGGGRGMRIVSTPAELASAVAAAAREAAAAFGDGTVFLEPFIAGARHIEVQILGDGYGNIEEINSLRTLGMATATSSTWGSASVRSSAATRRSSKRRRPPGSILRSGLFCAMAPLPSPVTSVTRTPVPSSSS